jgi:hypothetical protein
VGDGFLDNIVGNGPYRFGHSRFRSPLAEAGDRGEPLIRRRRDKFMLGRPPEDPLHDSSESIAIRSGETVIDPLIASRLKSERAKVAGHGVTVELAERFNRPLDVVDLARGLTQLAVIVGRPFQVSDTKLRDREIVRVIPRSVSTLATTQEPFRDESIVFGSTLRGVVLSEVNASTAKCDHGENRRAMQTVRRSARLTLRGHGQNTP